MLQQLLNNPQMFRQQFNSFVQNFQRSGNNPQKLVQDLLNSGQMSQSQFNQVRNMANKLTGQHF